MVKALSTRYQKEIALLLFSVFFSGFYATIQAKPWYSSYHKKTYSVSSMTTELFQQNIQKEFTTPLPEMVSTQKEDAHTTTKEDSPETDGPGQPEMQSFQSVNSNNMVDLFSGDFSYNIPLLDVGGYPVNIHYSSGVSMDQEASWVGLGWNINPGTITRNMRGLPDDFNGKDSIKKTFNIRPNVTAGVSADFRAEMFGKELPGGLNTGIYYNNYTGPGFELGINPTLLSSKSAQGDKTFGVDSTNLSLGVKYSSSGGFSANPNFATYLSNTQSSSIEGVGNIGLNYNSRSGLKDLTVSFNGSRKHGINKANEARNPTRFSHSITFARASYMPLVTIPFTSLQFSFKVKAGGAIFGFHPNGAIGGHYSQQYIKEADRTSTLPAYGYLHYQAGNGDSKALLDFNRESDLPYSKKIPHVSIPVYTYDTYSITGEGTGGMFRPYRGDVGYVRDHDMRTKNISGNLGLDIGGGNLYHAGADLSFNYTYTANKKWETENSLKNSIPFRSADSTFENVYFRNPSEKTSNTEAFYDAVGNSDLMRVAISNNLLLPQASNSFTRYNEQKRPIGTTNINANTLKTTRDKRGQVISYLTAREASRVGLDTAIKSYPVNRFSSCVTCYAPPVDSLPCYNCRTLVSIPGECDTVMKESRVDTYRLPHHLSQITVLNPDGRTYVYGIPAYNITQKEVTFAVKKGRGTSATGLVGYTPGTDNSTSNDNGKDHFFSKEETPAYAHSFLLSGVLSPDYVDVKGDGITPDDFGDAVKFNYSKIYSGANPYRWRTPYAQDSASYQEGFKTDHSDDKGSYVYGEKEIWYMHSIESKTMVATFTVEDRADGLSVVGENGGRNNSSGLKRLKEINLYSKKDLQRYRTAAKPIKTVHFSYNYTLCKKIENTGQDSGKLTLTSIWFTYNKNNKGKQNPYAFTYKSHNPDYNKKGYDRWGNYKPASDNTGGLLNDEFPYAIQDSAKAAYNVAAWALDTIGLPSGGKMVIDYESDDYAFVQNKRASQMFGLLGFNDSPDSSTIKSHLYTLFSDYRYVFIDLPELVHSKKEFFQKYLQGNTKLFFRINVKMPGDTYGSGFENIPCYVEFVDYGIANPSGSKKAWIRLKEERGQSPLTVAALQYLRLNLPSKAYPGSDVQGSTAAAAMVRILFSMVPNIGNLLLSFEKNSRLYGWAKEVIVTKSIIRLNNPNYKKFGGGLRVKRVRTFDNWKKMTNQKESVYGQEYDYTTVREINGKRTTISSGVATYEPSIGNEENPFHLPLDYVENTSIIGPSFNKYIDNPVGESFFPSASVGYSKVRVSSINRAKTRSANGFEETEFYTAFDFPVVSDFTPFDNNSKRNFNSPLKYFIPDARHYLTLTQGFKIETNDMHGKLKAQATYAENDSLRPISYTRNFYLIQNQNAQKLALVNKVPVLSAIEGGIITTGTVGKDIELMVDMREQKSETIGANVQLNHTGFVIPFFIPLFINIPSFFPVPNHSVSIYRAATVMKVINSYGILDSVVHFEKGSTISVKNVVYDQETGDALLVRTQNEFNDPVYNFSYPSHAAYDGTGPAYKNIGAVFQSLSFDRGLLVNSYYDKFFTHGDEILVQGLEENPCTILPTYAPVYKRLWVIGGGKVGEAARPWFIDQFGNGYSGNQNSIKIIRSGRRNMASSVGSISTLKNPVQLVIGQQKIVFNDFSKILAASAVQMKDDWKEDTTLSLCDTSTKPGMILNPFLHGMVGNWRPQRSYTYYGARSETDPSNVTDIRRHGTFADFAPFWTFGATGLTASTDTSRWVWNSEMTAFNRKGYEIENRDPLGRYNSGLYGYNHSLPVAVAQNAKHREISFQGFEDYGYNNPPCPDSCSEKETNSFGERLIDTIERHTGKYSLRTVYESYVFSVPVNSDTTDSLDPLNLRKVFGGFNNFCRRAVIVNNDNFIPNFSPIRGTKMIVGAWVKQEQSCTVETYVIPNIALEFKDGSGASIAIQYIYASGNIIEGWQRMESVVTVPLNASSMEVKFFGHNYIPLNYDDFRIHPFNSNLKSFVYHPTNLRLMAELDENNYATFYEYDDDGTLIRVKKETQKGIKTIKETRSALVKN